MFQKPHYAPEGGEYVKPSRNFLSLPIVSLREGQHIGYVKQLVVDRQRKAIAALVIDPKGFFKDQRIIAYNKVISVGDDAITIDQGTHVEKAPNLPEIITLLREKSSIIGTKVVTETGKTLGTAEEYYVDCQDGSITLLEISGGKIEGFLNGKALLAAQHVLTIGHDVIVAEKGSESKLEVTDKGLSDTIRSVLHSTSHLTSETSQALSKYFKRNKSKVIREEAALVLDVDQLPAQDSPQITESLPAPVEESTQTAASKDTLG